MKVLILGSKEYPLGTNKNDALPSGGIEVCVQELIKNLSNEDEIDIAIITRRFSGSYSYEKDGRVEIYRVRWLKGFFFRNISFNFMAFFRALRIDFEVIHAHGPIAGFFGFALSKIKKVPLIVTPHGLSLDQPQYPAVIRRFFSVMEKFVYSRADCIVFLSDTEKDVFNEKLGFIPDRYKIIHSGVDFEKFKKGDSVRIKKEFDVGGRTVITFTGRLIEVKGVKYLIKAANMIKDRSIVLIVGDGPDKKKLKKMSDELKIDNIIFTGHRNDIPDILSATDIFVLPSLSEGLPMALLEAMAAGCACVVTDIGLPIENGTDALVVKAGDSKMLAEALLSLLDNPEKRKKLGENARKKASEMFSGENSTNSYLQLFEELTSIPLDSL